MSHFSSPFDAFFGGGSRQPKGPSKAKGMLKEMSVTLEEVY